MNTARQVVTDVIQHKGNKGCQHCGEHIPARKVYCDMDCRVAFASDRRKRFSILDAEKVKTLFRYDAVQGRMARLGLDDPAGSIDSWGYRQHKVFCKQHLEHRLVWLYHFGNWPDGEIDHINHNRLDNRVENLRVVTRKENQKNLPKRKTTLNGMTGVVRRKSKWEARITSEGRLLSLGRFNTLDEAISARRVAERQLGYHPNHGQDLRNGEMA